MCVAIVACVGRRELPDNNPRCAHTAISSLPISNDTLDQSLANLDLTGLELGPPPACLPHWWGLLALWRPPAPAKAAAQALSLTSHSLLPTARSYASGDTSLLAWQLRK